MPNPFVSNSLAGYDCSDYPTSITDDADLRFMCGGLILDGIIQDVARGCATFNSTTQKVHYDTNVCSNGFVTSGGAVEVDFKQKAIDLAEFIIERTTDPSTQTHRFSGFGEISALHVCPIVPSGDPCFEGWNPGLLAYELFEILVDVAATYDVPIDIHYERVDTADGSDVMPDLGFDCTNTTIYPNPPVGQDLSSYVSDYASGHYYGDGSSTYNFVNVSRFENLLNYAALQSPEVKIIYQHAGFGFLGTTTPAYVRHILDTYDNVYVGYKISPGGPTETTPVFVQNGAWAWDTATTTYNRPGVNIESTDWRSLMLGLIAGDKVDYSDRFVPGSDEKPGPCDAALSATPTPCYPDKSKMQSLWQTIRDSNLFTDAEREKTAEANPSRLYGF